MALLSFHIAVGHDIEELSLRHKSGKSHLLGVEQYREVPNAGPTTTLQQQ
ncbi:hypothetical protein AB6813_21800 [bacterium RCC_150]